MRRPALQRPSRTLGAVIAITIAALSIRLWALGWRVAHQDEGRVADWIIHYIKAGHWEYRAIIHGPFIPHVNGVLFPIVGANDFTARLIVAVVGGLLPLAAWLFRTRLDRTEVVGLAALLALNPVLVYYSRFMRNDVLLAAFALIALGFAVRAYDTGRPWYLHAAAIVLGLGFTTKENALLYPVAWFGAILLVGDFTLLAARNGRRSVRTLLREWVRAGVDALRRWWRHLAAGGVEFAMVVVLFYAPLPGLWQAVTDPTKLPGVLHEATVGTWYKFAGQWAIPGMRDHAYTEFASFYLGVLEAGGLAILLLAALGVIVARYGEEERPFVAFCTYWGIASVAGYPIVMDIQGAWNAAHSLVPLAVPAAVGVGALIEPLVDLSSDERLDGVLLGVLAVAGYWAVRTLRDVGIDPVLAGEPTSLAAASIVAVVALLVVLAVAGTPVPRPTEPQLVAGIAIAGLVLAGAHAGAVTYDTSFERPQSADNPLVQYAQPSGQMQGTLADIRRVSRTNEGVDVLFYGQAEPVGDGCHMAQPTETWLPPDDPPCGWFSRLPLPWYMSAYDVETDSATSRANATTTDAPVVIALGSAAYGVSEKTAEDIDSLTDRGYEQRTYQGYLWGRPVVFYVDTDRVS